MKNTLLFGVRPYSCFCAGSDRAEAFFRFLSLNGVLFDCGWCDSSSPLGLWVAENGGFRVLGVCFCAVGGAFLVCIGTPFGMNRDRMASFSRCFRWVACFYRSDV